MLPIILLANMFSGIWLNLSFWYKQSGQTQYAIWITGTGLVFTVGLNLALTPALGYPGAALARLGCETAMVVVSYYLNRKHCPTPYDLPRIGSYFLAGGAIYALSLLTVDEIPEDADCVMIYEPSSDISEEEREMLSDYTKNGGKLLVIAGPVQDGELTNLNSLLADYGVEVCEGIVVEGSRESYTVQPHILLPDMNSSDITDPLIEEHYYPNMPISQGLIVSESAGDNVTELLTTSDQAFSKVAGYDLQTYEKEDGDIDGPFAVAVSIACDNDGQIVWFSSAAFLDDMYNALSSGSNSDLAMNALSSLIGETEAMAIRSKSLNYNYLSISGSTASLLKVLMIGVFPIGYLCVGVYVILKRRKKQNEAG